MKKTNPLKTPLKAHSASSLVIGSNPIFSTDKASERSGAFFVEVGLRLALKPFKILLAHHSFLKENYLHVYLVVLSKQAESEQKLLSSLCFARPRFPLVLRYK